MRIHQNIASTNTYRMLGKNEKGLASQFEKLSSGSNINKGSDYAAGLGISEEMRSQIRGLDQGARNIQDAISLLQTADGGMSEVHALLQRGRDLSVLAANEITTSDDKSKLQEEISQIIEEIDKIGETTEFNTIKILDASSLDPNALFIIQAGANIGQNMTVGFCDMKSSSLLIDNIDVTVDALDARSKLDNAIETVSVHRLSLGSLQCRLEHTMALNQLSSESLQKSDSMIRDVDMAKSMMEYTKMNMLAQSSKVMLVQANIEPQSVLQLLNA